MPSTSSTNKSSQKNFKFYFKCNVAKVTSESHTTAASQLNAHEATQPNNWLKKINKATNSIQQNDTENRFFIFGLFFLNTPKTSNINNAAKEMSASTSDINLDSNSTNQVPRSPSSNLQNASNKLVFFLFNCVPDNLKHSIVNCQSNTYLIRKPLFSNQKIAGHHKTPAHNANRDFNSNSYANANASSDTYRFYCNKYANDIRRHTSDTAAFSQHNNNAHNLNAKSNTNSAMNHNLNSQTSSSIIKKSFSISDILRDHLIFNKLNDYDTKPEFFLNYIDYIEESCAKSYIKSVVHYLGLYATQRLMSTIPKQIKDTKIPIIVPELNLNIQDIKLNTSPMMVPLPATEAGLTAAETPAQLKFDPKSIYHLLKIGRKIKLIDLDLTKYLKIICSHLKGHKVQQQQQLQNEEESIRKPGDLTEEKVEDDVFSESKASDGEKQEEEASLLNESVQKPNFNWEECRSNAHNLKSQYLEKKFDELILKRFNLLPGFDDLFIFMPSVNSHQPGHGHTLDFEQLVHGAERSKSAQRGHRRPNSLDLSQQQVEKELMGNASPKSFDIADYSDFEYNFDDSDDEKVHHDNASFDDELIDCEDNEENEDADDSDYFNEKER